MISKKRWSYLFAFVMILNILIGNLSAVANAETSDQTVKINETILEFDNVIYVEESTGNDETGTGTKALPYKTLEAAVKSSVTEPSESYCFKLGDGNYSQARWLRNTVCENEIAIIGNSNNTNLLTTENFNTNITSGVDNAKCVTKYYNFIWNDNGDGSNTNRHLFKQDVYMYNIVFDLNHTTYSYGYLISFPGKKVVLENCTITKPVTAFLRKEWIGNGEISLTNCYGPFISGYSTVRTDWDKNTNIIFTQAPVFDDGFKITTDGWISTGTGTNPDGTQANIGVYGGAFSWDNTGGNNPNPQTRVLKVVLEPEEKLQLSVDEDLAENTKLSWTSSDSAVATVDGNGMVTAISAGNAVITVSSQDGTYTEEIKVLVLENAKEYRLAIDLKVGEKCRLTIDDAEDLIGSWSVMDSSIATITDKGRVTAVSEGLTIVTAYDENGAEVGQVYVRVR